MSLNKPLTKKNHKQTYILSHPQSSQRNKSFFPQPLYVCHQRISKFKRSPHATLAWPIIYYLIRCPINNESVVLCVLVLRIHIVFRRISCAIYYPSHCCRRRLNLNIRGAVARKFGQENRHTNPRSRASSKYRSHGPSQWMMTNTTGDWPLVEAPKMYNVNRRTQADNSHRPQNTGNTQQSISILLNNRPMMSMCGKHTNFIR